jgi:radial spoke head protein 9
VLPQPRADFAHLFDAMSVYFSGEFDRVLINAHAQSDILNVLEVHGEGKKPLAIPSRGVTELERLAYVVGAIEADCQAVPVGSFKMTPLKEVRRNAAFDGLKVEQAF